MTGWTAVVVLSLSVAALPSVCVAFRYSLVHHHRSPRATARVCSSTALFSFIPDTSSETNRLLRFLNEEECEGMEELSIGINPSGLRGLFATADANAGEFLAAIPFVTALVVHDDNDENMEQNDTVENRPRTEAMRHGLAFLQRFVPDDRLMPYMATLPRMESPTFDPTPDFWDPSLLERIEIPSFIAKAQELRTDAKDVASASGCDLEELRWASWVVRTRGFTTFQTNPAKRNQVRSRTVLIPFFDMINHSDDPNASIEAMMVPGADDESIFALQALRPIQAGDQVTIAYGTNLESSLDMMEKYGFFIPGNPADTNIDWDRIDPQWSAIPTAAEAAPSESESATTSTATTSIESTASPSATKSFQKSEQAVMSFRDYLMGLWRQEQDDV